jgi:hypothetical protein
MAGTHPMIFQQQTDPRRRVLSLAALVLAAILPAACTTPPPPTNPFLGNWATQERSQITFRDTTIVMNPPNEAPTPLSPATCSGKFRFDYSRKSRDALTGLIGSQPDLRARLGKMLVAADYQVAELGCDNGQNTYVLLGDRDLLAIYRDGDIANIERLQRL